MDTIPLITRTYELYKHCIELNLRIEKRWRYTFGQNLEQSLLQLLSELIMAKNVPKQLKAAYLLRASSHVEISTLKLRLYLEFAVTNETKIFQAQAKLAEIGRMVGGWLKSLQST